MPPIGRTQLEDAIEACLTCELKTVEECYALRPQYGTIANTFAALEREGWEYFRTRDSGMYRRTECPVHRDPPVEAEPPAVAEPEPVVKVPLDVVLAQLAAEQAAAEEPVVPEPPPVSEPVGPPEDPALADTQPMPGPVVVESPAPVVEVEVVSIADPVVPLPDPPVEVPYFPPPPPTFEEAPLPPAPPGEAPWEELPGAGLGEEP